MQDGKRSKIAAMLTHDALLVQWLLMLPWRQRNIRECRIGIDPTNANLFKATKPMFIHLALSTAIEERIREDPQYQFWQFHFRPHETKSGNEARGVGMHELIRSLEEYLQYYRPMLVGCPDPGTLFLNQVGGCLDSSEMTSLVSTLTMRYVGRRVTPHIFRDIVAYQWLVDHPEDYLTLSKLLWHRDIKTTLGIYGRKL